LQKNKIPHGTGKKTPGIVLVAFLCFYGRADIRDLQSLGVADPDTALSNYCLCKGHGYYVNHRSGLLPRSGRGVFLLLGK
jgi:hypothetical protein